MLAWDGWLRLGSITATIGVLAGLWFTNHSLQATYRQYALSEQVQVNDRFAKATEQLGSSTIDVRLGGIYSLQKLSRDSVKDRATIANVLSAFIRARAPITPDCGVDRSKAKLPLDIQAALAALVHRDVVDGQRIDLSKTCLAGADLRYSNPQYVYFGCSVLNFARLDHAFVRPDITSENGIAAFPVDFSGAQMQEVEVFWADLTGANFSAADLSRSTLAQTNFSRGYFFETSLRGTTFGGGLVVDGADFRGADLRSVNWVLFETPAGPQGFSSAKFDGSVYDATTHWPTGFVPQSSGEWVDRTRYGCAD